MSETEEEWMSSNYTELTRCTSKLTAVLKELERLKRFELPQKDLEIQQLKHSLTAADELVEQCKAHLTANSSGHIAALTERTSLISKLQSENARLKLEMEIQTTSTEERLIDNERARKDYLAQCSKNNELTAQLDSEMERHARAIHDKDATIQELKSKVSDLESQLRVNQTESQCLKKELKKIKAETADEIANLKGECEKLKKSEPAKSSEFVPVVMPSEIVGLRAENTILKESEHKLQTELMNIYKQLNTTAPGLVAMKADLQQTKEAYAATKTALEQSLLRYQELQNERNKLSLHEEMFRRQEGEIRELQRRLSQQAGGAAQGGTVGVDQAVRSMARETEGLLFDKLMLERKFHTELIELEKKHRQERETLEQELEPLQSQCKAALRQRDGLIGIIQANSHSASLRAQYEALSEFEYRGSLPLPPIELKAVAAASEVDVLDNAIMEEFTAYRVQKEAEAAQSLAHAARLEDDLAQARRNERHYKEQIDRANELCERLARKPDDASFQFRQNETMDQLRKELQAETTARLHAESDKLQLSLHLEQQRKAVESLKEKVKYYEEEMKKIETQCDGQKQLAEQIKVLKESIEHKDIEEKSKLESEYQKAVRDYSQAQSELREMRKKKDELEVKNIELNSDFNNQLSEKENQIGQLKTQQIILEKANADMKAKAAKLQEVIDDLKHREKQIMRNLNDEDDGLVSSNFADSTINNLKLALEESQAKYSKEKAHSAELAKVLTDAQARYDVALTTLQEKLDTEKKKAEQFGKELKVAQTELSLAVQTLNEFGEHQKLADKCRELEEKNGELSGKCAVLLSKNESLLSENEAMRMKVEEEKRKYELEVTAHGRDIYEYEELDKKLKALENEYACLQSDKITLVEQLSMRDGKIAKREEEMKSLVALKDSKIKSLQEANDGLLSEYSDVFSKIKDMVQRPHADMTPEAGDLISQMEAMEYVKRERLSLMQELSEHREEIARLRESERFALEEVKKKDQLLGVTLTQLNSRSEAQKSSSAEKQILLYKESNCSLRSANEQMKKEIQSLVALKDSWEAKYSSQLEELRKREQQFGELEEEKAALAALAQQYREQLKAVPKDDPPQHAPTEQTKSSPEIPTESAPPASPLEEATTLRPLGLEAEGADAIPEGQTQPAEVPLEEEKAPPASPASEQEREMSPPKRRRLDSGESLQLPRTVSLSSIISEPPTEGQPEVSPDTPLDILSDVASPLDALSGDLFDKLGDLDL